MVGMEGRRWVRRGWESWFTGEGKDKGKERQGEGKTRGKGRQGGGEDKVAGFRLGKGKS